MHFDPQVFISIPQNCHAANFIYINKGFSDHYIENPYGGTLGGHNQLITSPFVLMIKWPWNRSWRSWSCSTSRLNTAGCSFSYFFILTSPKLKMKTSKHKIHIIHYTVYSKSYKEKDKDKIKSVTYICIYHSQSSHFFPHYFAPLLYGPLQSLSHLEPSDNCLSVLLENREWSIDLWCTCFCILFWNATKTILTSVYDLAFCTCPCNSERSLLVWRSRVLAQAFVPPPQKKQLL